MDKNRRLVIVMSVVLLVSVSLVTRFFATDNKWGNGRDEEGKNLGEDNLDNNDMPGLGNREIVIVLDAGHGGVDPGKVGVDGQLEKDINLSIVMKLKEALESDSELGAKVILTRTDDSGLYSEDSTNKKREDMKNRCEIIEDSKPDLVVSIHQNSYHSSSVKGAQVFYYEKSEKGKLLANKIQGHLVTELSNGKKGRVEKANDNYFLILNVKCPAVIVECGFLSNEDEARLLVDEEYQKKITKAIVNGIRDYLQEY
jgi:N-acetylmuramoyl-L-alanine amidase